MNKITEFAPAKINLSLQVTGRRPDGYHLLDSLVVFADVGDLLRITPSKELSLTISGPFSQGLSHSDPGDNLVLKAAHRLQGLLAINKGAKIHLVKNLPISSGIGGGSTDAAAAIRGLLRLWQAEDLSPEKQHRLALELGADVPVCLVGNCRWMQGVGEILKKGPTLPKLHAVLLNYGEPVSTPGIFKSLGGKFSQEGQKSTSFYSLQDLCSYLERTGNDLQLPALKTMPAISDCLAELAAQSGCVYSGMSGSGATCFGLYEDKNTADQASLAIASAHPEWWVKSTIFV